MRLAAGWPDLSVGYARLTVGGVMRSNVNSLLPIRTTTRVTALHAPAGQARRPTFLVRSVPGLLLFLMEQKFNTDGLGCALTSAVFLSYIAVLCGMHYVRQSDTNVPAVSSQGEHNLNKSIVTAIAAVLLTAATIATAEQVKRALPACVSEDLLDELSTYAAKGDNAGFRQLLMSGQCTLLTVGSSVSVISTGFVVATIRYKGVKLFAPSEAVR